MLRIGQAIATLLYGTRPTPEQASAHSLPLRLNFSWTFVGNVILAGCQWGMVVLLSKLGSAETVGQFALASTITTPVIRLANLELQTVQATDAKKAYAFGHYIALRSITSTLSLPLVGAIGIASGYRRETMLVIMAMALAKACEGISGAFHGLLQQHERMDRAAKALMLRGIFSVLTLGAGLCLSHSLPLAMLGLALASGLLIAYDVHSALALLAPGGTRHRQPRISAVVDSLELLRPRWERRALRRLARSAAPLGIVGVLGSLSFYVPRYIVEQQLGEQQLGLFAALSYLMVAGNTVVNALSQSASPRLAKYLARREIAAFRHLLLILVGIGVSVGVAATMVAAVAGDRVLMILYGPEYASQAGVLTWLMVAAAVHYVSAFLRCGTTAAHYYRVQPLYLSVSTAVSAGFCLFLVPRYGLVGAAWALIAAYCVEGVAGVLCNRHAIRSQRVLARSTDVASRETSGYWPPQP